ncbi:MAG: DinB family protein, partial [Gemmatimonadales bacterium]
TMLQHVVNHSTYHRGQVTTLLRQLGEPVAATDFLVFIDEHPDAAAQPLSITVDELRDLLERGEPVTVLDVRPPTDRAEWFIPGSTHVDVHDALWAGDGAVVAPDALPADRPVVTVCGRGRTSLLAAQRLRAQGIPARSLAGGMEAWTLAWNTADVPVPRASASVVQVRRTGKGCLSYVLGSAGHAAVIDPSVDPQVYIDLAGLRGWAIGAVLDTHVHADHLSRARALAERTGATLYLPRQDRVAFPFTPLDEGGQVPVGEGTLRALRTPGHTFESTCYLLDGRALFTGDTLFLNAVGRPDLEASRDEARRRAYALHGSLQRILGLPADTLVLPAHTDRPVSFDGRPLCAALTEVRARIDLPLDPASAFVEAILARIPPAPANHKQIVILNEAGLLPPGDTALEAGANRCAVS